MDYENIFSKETMKVLKGKSSDNLKQMIGDKSTMQAMQDSLQLLKEIIEIEKPYRSQLENLAKNIAIEMYPIISDNNIEIQAKIVDSVTLTPTPPKEDDTPSLNDSGDDSKRRIINSITQGGSLRGSFAFYLFIEYLDKINPNLVNQYGDLLKNSYGIYDDDQTIAMMLSMLSRNAQTNGGEVDVDYNENEDKFIIKAQALCFPILLQEIIKGLYEIISLEGFTSDPEVNKAIVKQVDKTTNEPEDIRYGKYIYDAVNDLYISQNYNDPRIREYFLTELYKLPNKEFEGFIENLIQNKLTSSQQRWVTNTMQDIDSDIKQDDNETNNLYEIMKNMKLTTLLKEIITEVSIDQLRTQFVDSEKISSEDFEEAVEASGGKTAYTTWLVKKVADNIIKSEDIYKYKKYFSIFNRRKKEYPYSDINQYKTPQDISQFISKSVEIDNKEKQDPSQQKGITRSDKYKEFYVGSADGFDVYKLPKGRKDLYGVSCELGSGTEWCTATGKTRNHFENYISKGPLFIFIKPGSNEKYQFSYESNEFRDKDDNMVI